MPRVRVFFDQDDVAHEIPKENDHEWHGATWVRTTCRKQVKWDKTVLIDDRLPDCLHCIAGPP